MASSKQLSDDKQQRLHWNKWIELLPGLEDFLTIVLASENLSHFAEERRQFFIERLDIVKLPPSLPPREGRVLPPELLKETEETSGIPTSHNTPDFAATQREISRSYIESNTGTDASIDGIDTSPIKGVKEYDDIDTVDSDKESTTLSKRPVVSDVQVEKASDDDSDDNEDNALYEIPVARQQLSADSNSQSYGADCSSIATAGSTEELPDDVLDTTLVAYSPIPPPLPPRRDIKFSDSGSRNSVNFEEKPPELPYRPPLPKRNELNTRSDKSDRSEKSNNSDAELSDGGSTSYESFDEDERHDADLTNKLSVQLPKKPNKKMTLKKSKKLSGSRSSSQWEISVPFRKLDNIDISGELYYKGKLRWNRRIVAISNGCLAMYKPDKDARPSMVIPLTGYEASVTERDGRKGFELKLVHPNADFHSFSVDFKEWAALWMEHINGCSKGQPPAKYHTHLARTFSGDVECVPSTTTSGSKLSLCDNNSIELEYDQTKGRSNLHDELFIKEEGDCDSVKSSPVESLSNKMARKFVARHFQSEKSPLHFKRRTLGHSPRSSPFSLTAKDKTISTTVKDILRRRQRAMYTIQNVEPCNVPVERYTPMGDSPVISQERQVLPENLNLPSSALPPASALSISRWDWKNIFYNMSMPLDQLILAFRRTDLNESNSNLSTGSEGGSEDSLRSRIKGNKVMRMGSFAFRATQFFENIGKGTKSKKKSQNSVVNFRHSGDFTGVHDILEEPASSTGNLVRNKVNATSDSNLHAGFFGSDSLFSLPPASKVSNDSHQWDDDDYDDNADVTHKGYLHIFSSFNKRRWGKRWCLVRENMFECYKSSCSKQCELNFLLKPCVLRRAIAETNSDRGLMIMQSGREKITVEPLSKEEMGKWVRVLLLETSTQNVPEGLEEFVKESKGSDGDTSSVMSFTVLKQWDMDCLVPTKNTNINESKNPVPGIDVTKQLLDSCHSNNSEIVFNKTDNTALNNSSTDSMSHSVSISESSTHKPGENLLVYPKNKHATDSGFYSTKGTNSDTDSSHEAGELEFAYATQDSRNSYSSQNSKTPSIGNSPTSPDNAQESCHFILNSCSDKSVSNSHLPQLDKPSPSNCVHLSNSSSLKSPSQIPHNLTLSTSESHLNMVCALDSHKSCKLHQNIDISSVLPDSLNMSKRYSKSSSAVNTPSRTDIQTVPCSSGEEYSVVLKRSDRSSKSSETSIDLNNTVSTSSTPQARTSIKLEDDDNNENDFSVFRFTNSSDEQQCNVTNSDTESSYYEPICRPHSIPSNAANQSMQTVLSNNSQQFSPANVEIGDRPPPIPTSPIPDLTVTPPFAFISPSLKSSSPKEPNNLPELMAHVSSDINKINSNPNLKLNTSDEANISGHVHETVNNGDLSTVRHSDIFLSCEAPLSPTSDAIAAVIENSNATIDELKRMTERLKIKQAEIKRKRLAVHDKRQRVSSDEERLACEKEIASLERVAEVTELDIRTIQSQLETAQSNSLEAMKPSQGKIKLLSKKRKGKKKQ